MPNVLSPRDLVSRPDNMDETVPHIIIYCQMHFFCADFDLKLGEVHLFITLTYFCHILAADSSKSRG